jgi:ArsR family transcriptional regulator
MGLVEIYQCLCDRTRLRILHLLTRSPLCVCHFQEILDEPQVKISKHLAYLRARGLVATKRSGNWIIYSLPSKRPAELEANLKCLRDCVASDPVFRKDLHRLARLRSNCSPLAKRVMHVATGGTGFAATDAKQRPGFQSPASPTAALRVPSVFLSEETCGARPNESRTTQRSSLHDKVSDVL